MTIYSFYIFDRHCECIYIKQWHERERAGAAIRPTTSASTTSPIPDKRVSAGGKQITETDISMRNGRLSVQDDAKLIFGVVFSLRNMVRKLSTPDDNFISYRTNNYKLHYYETPTNLKFVMITDVKTNNLRVVLHQIYVNLYVEYVIARNLYVLMLNNYIAVEHSGGEGVACELFELGLESFVVRTLKLIELTT
ncbi:snare-like protein [Terfezia boudieri ATCC MYA-4762]|uniref:Trafficking protein particle complex subunit n=1 Tax=Terfezia boudieri ATCC MYA-4762 TaxID=1051890 RepID=A0A3N4LM32_9PEZI|nr:snare-like protein [Terfezia boudieri ATCC MYA-4762]